MNQWQKDQFDKSEKRGYLPKLRELAMNMTVPFFWSVEPNHMLHSGTLCLLRTPERRIGVSAYHVWKQYQKDLAEFGDDLEA